MELRCPLEWAGHNLSCRFLADHIPVAYHIICHVDSIGVDLFNAFLWILMHHALEENLQVG